MPLENVLQFYLRSGIVNRFPLQMTYNETMQPAKGKKRFEQKLMTLKIEDGL